MEKKKIQLKVKKENYETIIEAKQGQNLLELLRENFHITGNCGGNGLCGKCKVKILSEVSPITEAERYLLTKEEMSQGVRLACKTVIEAISEMKEDFLYMEIMGKSEDDIVVEGVEIEEIIIDQDTEMDARKCERRLKSQRISTAEPIEEKIYFIAVDIGTTTIAMALVNEENGQVIDTYSSVNHQRKFGTDVISRITAANAGKGKELKTLVEEDLWRGICKLAQIEECGECNSEKLKDKEKKVALINSVNIGKKSARKIRKIVMAGNTTMIHLLMGYSCESLGVYPFGSDYLSQKECLLKECVTVSWKSDYENIPVTILPGISAFVGADIMAGMLACKGFEKEKISLLIDLGTNGEMVLGNKDRLVATSVAAGPAFEGGNIRCGIASVPGAISKVKIENQRAIVKTINGQLPPVGICGTGLISVIAQLKKNKIMDEDGGLRFPYNQNGFSLWKDESGESIKIYQKDIREFQMAKAAVRAGIEILMEEFGCTPVEIDTVYLAGGFGTRLDEEEAVETGILPLEFAGKIQSIGNSAQKGVIDYGLNKKEILNQNIRIVSLAQKKEFQEMYIKNVNFVV